jgi:DNA-binding SARP family transcriptional activator
MEYRILGPVEVCLEGRPLPLGGAKQRALLAILLLNANRVVSTDRLVEALWGEHPPESAGHMLHVYVSRWRKAFQQAGSGGDVLVTLPPGYMLRVESGELDLLQFEDLAERGRVALAEGNAQDAASMLREAAHLWRGPALADFTYEEFASVEIGRLEDGRWAAIEDRLEADLALGRHAEMIGELRALIAEQPLRERLRAHLMVALYRSGRQAEALKTYQDARRTLAEELGIDPSQELRRLENAILNQDPSLDRGPPAVLPSDPTTTGATYAEPREVLQARPPGRRRRRGIRRVGVAVLAVSLVSASAVYALRATRSGPASLGGPNTLVRIDPAAGRAVEEIAVGKGPSAIASGAGGVWVANFDERTVSRIDLSTGRERPIGGSARRRGWHGARAKYGSPTATRTVWRRSTRPPTR